MARKYDPDGRLHVTKCRLTKANICEYFGYEIPKGDELGLDPDKLYRLYRDPDELKKAVDTFNNVPVLDEHVLSSAKGEDEHKPDNIVGSTGTSALFKDPYIINDIVIWSKKAIDAVEDDSQREISASYYYTADMTKGSGYDGVMRDIHCNHVALVPEGRAGHDVLVGDQKPMKIKPIRSELTGAINALIRPKMKEKLAFDARPVLDKIKSASTRRLAERFYGLAQPLLAADEDLDIKDVVEVIKAVQGDEPAPAEDEDEENDDADIVAEDEEEGDSAAEKLKKVLDYVKEHMSEKDNEEIGTLISDLDRGDDEELEDKEDEKDDKPPAMDAAAIDRRIKAATEKVRREARDLRIAEKAVYPVTGELALDSAAAYYRKGLQMLGVKTDSLPESAFAETFRVVSSAKKATALVASDSLPTRSAEAKFEKRNPKRLRRL